MLSFRPSAGSLISCSLTRSGEWQRSESPRQDAALQICFANQQRATGFVRKIHVCAVYVLVAAATFVVLCYLLYDVRNPRVWPNWRGRGGSKNNYKETRKKRKEKKKGNETKREVVRANCEIVEYGDARRVARTGEGRVGVEGEGTERRVGEIRQGKRGYY